MLNDVEYIVYCGGRGQMKIKTSVYLAYLENIIVIGYLQYLFMDRDKDVINMQFDIHTRKQHLTKIIEI